MGDELRYMSTTSAVRDIEDIRVLERPDTPINFFGVSNGTVIGWVILAESERYCEIRPS